MTKPIIEVKGLSKRYKLGVFNAKTLREEAEAFLARFSRGKAHTANGKLHTASGPSTLDSKLSTPSAPDEFWALRDVSFDVQPGEVIGVIGRNGAGKSTLLKILSRITEPTSGEARIRGRVASLLEVGTGFHPELSGRENIFLNGAILGMTKQEIRNKFDEIVAFAEIEKFIDTPVKRYSSGMYVRLAFAVAAHLEPEILIVDEVLAVGDTNFQKKCLGKMQEVSGKYGRTVLFVSHNMEAVAALCPKCIYLLGGKVCSIGSTPDVLTDYLAQAGSTDGHFVRPRDLAAPSDWLIQEAYLTQHNKRVYTIRQEVPLKLFLHFSGKSPQKLSVEYVLRDERGSALGFCPLGLGYGKEYTLEPGVFVYEHFLDFPKLAAGAYSLDLILADTGKRWLDKIEKAVSFRIENTYEIATSWSFSQAVGQGAILLPPGEGRVLQR